MDRRLATSLFVLLQLASFGQAQVRLQPFDLKDGIGLSFPKAPKHEVLNQGLPLDRYTAQIGTTVYRAVLMDIPAKEQSMVQEEIDLDPNGKYVRSMLDQSFEGLLRSLGGKATPSEYGGFRGFPARRGMVKTASLTSYVLAILTPKRYVMLLMAFPNKLDDPKRVQAFFDSLELAGA